MQYSILPEFDYTTPGYLEPPKTLWLRVLLEVDHRDDPTLDDLHYEYVYDTYRPRGGLLVVIRHQGRVIMQVLERPRTWIELADIGL